MIYWFTGQPGAGKTTLAKKLQRRIAEDVYIIDGDDIRDLFSNKDYSTKGRVENVATAQRIAHYLHNHGKNVIVSLVSPYVDQREEFKKILGSNIREIYVHTSESRERDHFKAPDYVAPKCNFIDIDTTHDTPEESLLRIMEVL